MNVLNCWFSGFTWEKLWKEELEVPFPVTVTGPIDVTILPYVTGQEGLTTTEKCNWRPDFSQNISANVYVGNQKRNILSIEYAYVTFILCT